MSKDRYQELAVPQGQIFLVNCDTSIHIIIFAISYSHQRCFIITLLLLHRSSKHRLDQANCHGQAPRNSAPIRNPRLPQKSRSSPCPLRSQSHMPTLYTPHRPSASIRFPSQLQPPACHQLAPPTTWTMARRTPATGSAPPHPPNLTPPHTLQPATFSTAMEATSVTGRYARMRPPPSSTA